MLRSPPHRPRADVEVVWLPMRLCEGHLEGRHYQWPLTFCAVSIRSSEHSLLFPLICPPPPVVVDVLGHWLMRTAGVTVRQFSTKNPVAPGTRLVFHSRQYHSVFSTRLKHSRGVVRKVSLVYTV